MEFPITELLDYESSVAWVTQHFHPQGFQCPKCGAPSSRPASFGKQSAANWWCIAAMGVIRPITCYRNDFPANAPHAHASGFADARHLQRREFAGIGCRTGFGLRHRTDFTPCGASHAERAQPTRRYPISVLKPTKCFGMRGKKGEEHLDPDDPPRCRATNSADTGPMRMIDRQCLNGWRKVGKCGCGSFITRIRKRWRRMFTISLWPTRIARPTNG